MSAHLEEALNWIMEGENIQTFRNDFSVIFSQVNGLAGTGEVDILRKVHSNCTAVDESLCEAKVYGERSYGWEEK